MDEQTTRVEYLSKENNSVYQLQWRHQDLLRGQAKLEIRSWGTHGGLQSRVQQLLDD